MTSAAKESSPNLRIKGVKVFYDGALGSEGALLSRCYHGSESHGIRLWTNEELKEVLKQTWRAGFEVAVHAIGDEACAQVVDAAIEAKANGENGRLHLEHAEILRPETVVKMKTLDLQCHLQPAHWLSDRKWLKEKVGGLIEHAFPWRRLQEAEIPFAFGSDSPIEVASVSRTLQALRESADQGIPRLLGLPTSYMGHADLAWAPNSYTLLEEGEPTHVVFRGEHLV